ncbi:MAG: DUF3631 domain-containing protein [Allgaiera sp.]|jgi:putative DNA primase/helicase|nr:DUF3631 domain-containing protein [Allgaiera sp.]
MSAPAKLTCAEPETCEAIVAPEQGDALHPDEEAFTPSPADLVPARIAVLAGLPQLEYELIREAEAKALRLRVSVLDKAVGDKRPRDTGLEEADPFEPVEPWGEAVDGAALLAELQATIRRFCVLPAHTAPLMAGWVLHAWTHDAADISPLLAFTSPEKRCGKSTALSVIGALTPKSLHAVNITTAVLFRVVEKYQPTVLVDEADTFLTENEELRGVLNGGHNRLTAYVWRTVGDDHEPKRFKVWSPKCIAMIGKLPDTLEDRAISVPLKRKQPGEKVERFRADRVNELLHLRRKCARWADDNMMRLRDLDPGIPDELNDRAQDNARAICAIADLARGAWPEAIRAALVGLNAQAEDEPQSAGVLLLRDVGEIFEGRSGDRMGSTELAEALAALEESPWGEWRHGSPISTRGIAKLLKPYGVTPRRDREQRFYTRSDFADALNRYLPDTPEKCVTSVTSVTRSTSVTGKHNEISSPCRNDACDACLEGDAYKGHSDGLEGEL